MPLRVRVRWSRWAGWASKVVADHLGLGSKTGHPYIKHNKASNPFTNLMKEYKGLEWQEDVTRFLDTVQLSQAAAREAGTAYIELSWRVHETLGKLNPYFQVRWFPNPFFNFSLSLFGNTRSISGGGRAG